MMPAPHCDAKPCAHEYSHTLSNFYREQVPAENLQQDNDETNCKEGGVRFRENLGKYVVEYRPPQFKWKLWMGTYNTVDEGRRACDCARFYAGQDTGGFLFQRLSGVVWGVGASCPTFHLSQQGCQRQSFERGAEETGQAGHQESPGRAES